MDLDKPIFVITGPSASGKTTVAMAVIKSDLPVVKVVTTTTRMSREGEVDGIDYHFVSQDQFQTMIDHGEMFEWAEYDSNFYGSQQQDVDEIFASGNYPLWVIDIQGAEYFKQHFPKAVIFFIAPESLKALEQRLINRGDAPADIAVRLKIAQGELSKANLFNHRIINKDGELAAAVSEVIKLIKATISRFNSQLSPLS